jgi:arylsulfatase
MVGKWHLCPDDEMNLASTRRNWPTGRGFERWYGFLGAETSQWLFRSRQHLVDRPKSPEEGYHLSVDLTDKAIEFIMDAKAITRSRFPLLRARGVPRAAHAPRNGPTSTRAVSTSATRRCVSDAGPPEGARARPQGHHAAADPVHRTPRRV